MRIRDPRSKRQRYCAEPECKRASRTRSQKRWLSKPENRDYFAGPASTERVRQWRKANPNYWKKRKPVNKAPLQDLMDMYLADCNDVVVIENQKALQDFIKAQTAVMVGVVSLFSGVTQQDEIATILRACSNRGADIFGRPLV